MGAQAGRRMPLRARLGAAGAAAGVLAVSLSATSGAASAEQSRAGAATRPAASGVPAEDPQAEKKRIDAEIAKIRDQLDDSTRDVTDAYVALRRTQLQLPGAKKRLAAAEAARAAADKHNQAMADRLRIAQANEARAKDELGSTRKEITTTRKRVAGFAAQMYQNQGLGELGMAMDAESPTDLASRLAMSDTVADVQAQEIGRLEAARADASAHQAYLTALRVEIDDAKKEAEAALRRSQEAEAAAKQAKAELDGLAARQTAQAKAMESKRAKEEQRLSSMQGESSRLQKLLAARAAAARAAAAKAGAKVSAGAVKSSGFLASPMPGAPITSEFGMRFHPILHYARLHAGVDFGGPCGAKVYAPADGTVVRAGTAGGYGNQLVLDHGLVKGKDLTTTYNHLQDFVVRSGTVKRGQLIAHEGTTGLSTGCHLHFETRENGTPVNPRGYLS